MVKEEEKLHGNGGVYYGGDWVDLKDLEESGWACDRGGERGVAHREAGPVSQGEVSADVGAGGWGI